LYLGSTTQDKQINVLCSQNPSLAMNPGTEEDPNLNPSCPPCIENREWEEIRSFMLDTNML